MVDCNKDVRRSLPTKPGVLQCSRKFPQEVEKYNRAYKVRTNDIFNPQGETNRTFQLVRSIFSIHFSHWYIFNLVFNFTNKVQSDLKKQIVCIIQKIISDNLNKIIHWKFIQNYPLQEMSVHPYSTFQEVQILDVF